MQFLSIDPSGELGVGEEVIRERFLIGPRLHRAALNDRVGIFEFIPFDEGLSALVMEKAATEVLQKYAVAHGAITLREDAVTKVRDGLTTLEEALRVTIIDA